MSSSCRSSLMMKSRDLQNAHEIQKSWKSAHENEPVETQRSRIFDFSFWFAHVKEASKQPAASQARVIIKLLGSWKKNAGPFLYTKSEIGNRKSGNPEIRNKLPVPNPAGNQVTMWWNCVSAHETKISLFRKIKCSTTMSGTWALMERSFFAHAVPKYGVCHDIVQKLMSAVGALGGGVWYFIGFIWIFYICHYLIGLGNGVCGLYLNLRIFFIGKPASCYTFLSAYLYLY